MPQARSLDYGDWYPPRSVKAHKRRAAPTAISRASRPEAGRESSGRLSVAVGWFGSQLKSSGGIVGRDNSRDNKRLAISFRHVIRRGNIPGNGQIGRSRPVLNEV